MAIRVVCHYGRCRTKSFAPKDEIRLKNGCTGVTVLDPATKAILAILDLSVVEPGGPTCRFVCNDEAWTGRKGAMSNEDGILVFGEYIREKRSVAA